MLPFDWTTLKKPQLFDDRYYYVFESPVVLSEISETEKRQATTKGLSQLFLFYGKKTPGNINEFVDDSILLSEIYLDPRPNCFLFKILVSASKESLDKLPNQDYDLDNLIVVNFNTLELNQGIEQLSIGMARHAVYTHLFRKYVHVDDFVISLDTKVKLLKDFQSSIENRALLNGQTYIQSESDFIQLLFNSDREFAGIILNRIPLVKGHETLDLFISHLLSNLEEISPLIKKSNRATTREDWESFYRRYITYGVVSFKEPEREIGQVEQAALDILNKTNIPYFLDSRKSRVEEELSRIKDIPSQFLGNSCGPIELDGLVNDFERISKTKSQKEAEDILLNNSTFRGRIHEQNRNRLDYVGDIVFDSVPSLFPGGPRTLNDVYNNVLNYISVDTLIKKSIQCLLAKGELPDLWKLCIDVYVPFSLTLPDNLKIPDIFGFLSNLIVRALLFVLQQALFLLIDTILDALEKCIRGKLIDTGLSDSLDFFGNNLDAANVFIAQKVYDNLDSLSPAQVLVEDEFNESGTLLQDILAALTPQEFCMVMAGTATDDVYKIILCIIETRYPSLKEKVNTIEKVRSIFSALGALVDADKCTPAVAIPIPIDPTLCITREQLDIRENFLKNKFSNISKDLLDEQLEKSEERRKNTIDRLNKFLSSEQPFEDDIFGEQDKQDFIINLSPCSEENEPMKHMIELSTDSSIDPVTSYFNQALLSDLGLASLLKDSVRDSYVQNIRKNDFIKKSSSGFNIGFGANLIKYKRIQNGLTQLIESNNTFLQSVISAPPEVPQLVDDIRVSYFKSLDGILTDDDYNNCFIIITEFITSIIAKSNIYSASETRLRDDLEKVVSPVTGNSDLFENCWENGINVRNGINDSYFKKDCETRDTTLYTQSVLAGFLRLYVRTIMIDFFFKNLGIITQFHSKDLINTFIKEFILTRMAPIISSINSTSFINDIDELIEKELDVVYLEFLKTFEDFVNSNIQNSNKNILNYLWNEIDIVEHVPKVVLGKRFFFVPELNFDPTKNQLSVTMELKFAKTIGTFPKFATLMSINKKIKNPISFAFIEIQDVLDEMKEDMKNGRAAELLFNFSIPSNDILSFIGIYNVTRIRNNIFEQLFIMEQNIIRNLENSGNFTYRNRQFERRSKLEQVDAAKGGKRKKAIEDALE